MHGTVADRKKPIPETLPMKCGVDKIDKVSLHREIMELISFYQNMKIKFDIHIPCCKNIHLSEPENFPVYWRELLMRRQIQSSYIHTYTVVCLLLLHYSIYVPSETLTMSLGKCVSNF
jgi:hypothetical protein